MERRDSLGRPDAVPALGVPQRNPDAHMGTMSARPRGSRRSIGDRMLVATDRHAVSQLNCVRHGPAVRSIGALQILHRVGPGNMERRDSLGRPDAVPALGVPQRNPDALMGTMSARPRGSRRSSGPHVVAPRTGHAAARCNSPGMGRAIRSIGDSILAADVAAHGAPRFSRPTRRGPRVGRPAAEPRCAHGDHERSAERISALRGDRMSLPGQDMRSRLPICVRQGRAVRLSPAI